jgi:hypothetical protein
MGFCSSASIHASNEVDGNRQPFENFLRPLTGPDERRRAFY